MQIPSIYNSGLTSLLYDCFRNPDHLPPTVINLDWSYGEKPVDKKIQIEYNLAIMHTQMITQSKTQIDFFGKPYRAGDDIHKLDGAGQIQLNPLNNVHSWTGTAVDQSNPNYPIDMGALYSTARDPILYAHHANVDRMWTIWLNNLGGSNFTDPDWLNAYFIFYNEEANPVRVRVKDCLDVTKLGYQYEDCAHSLAGCECQAKTSGKGKNLAFCTDPAQVFPTTLDKPISVIVKRPKKSGTGLSKEILVIEGI
ncbi:polyphenol oxidase I [Abeliophyllum distichum]|uniref:Polyphenol oxidase I n=1 Tax=Abeliophyllum distichum TaxID=126358 RepID=A0ABD1ULX9_9LAMI